MYPDPRLAQEKVRRLVRRRRLRRRLRTGALVVSGLTAVGSLSFGVVQGIAVVRRVWATHHRHLTPARRTLSLSTSTTTTAPGPPPCASSQVLAQLSHWQVTSGILYELVVLEGTADAPCTLSGYANLTVSTSAGGTLPVPVHDDPNLGGQAGASTAPVVLAVGQPAWFEVSYAVTCASVLGTTSGTPGQCYRGRALGVLLPHATTALTVVQPLGFSFATSGFSVGPFGSGPPPPSAPVGP